MSEQFISDGHVGMRENNQVTEEKGEWWYEKVDGKWQHVLLPRLPLFDLAAGPEKDRRCQQLEQLLREMEEQWHLYDPNATHNEGFLRDHPRYRTLFEKWAIRYLRMKGHGSEVYSGRIHPDQGQLYGPDGTLIRKWLVNAVANGREWVDENIEMELLMSEGFRDITRDYERREELGIEPEHHGWWTQNEI